MPAGDPFVGNAGGHLPGSTGMLVFVFDLRAHDAAALAEIMSVHLPVQRAEKPAHSRQKAGIVFPHVVGLAIQPIGQAAVAHLPVIKGADAHDDHHLVLFADFQEAPQVPAAVEAENAFFLLVHVPKHIGGQDVDAAAFHFDDGVLPLIGGYPAEVHLPADAEEGPAVHRHIVVGEADPAPVRAAAGEFLPQGIEDLFRYFCQIQLIRHCFSSWPIFCSFSHRCISVHMIRNAPTACRSLTRTGRPI